MNPTADHLKLIEEALDSAIRADRQWGWIVECKLAQQALASVRDYIAKLEADRASHAPS